MADRKAIQKIEKQIQETAVDLAAYYADLAKKAVPSKAKKGSKS